MNVPSPASCPKSPSHGEVQRLFIHQRYQTDIGYGVIRRLQVSYR